MGRNQPDGGAREASEATQLLDELGRLTTEQRNSSTADIDLVDVETCLRLINDQDSDVPKIVRQQIPAIARAVQLVERSLRAGGRLVYIGAGTSGRLGVLDASECPPTFGTDPTQVIGVIAGGVATLVRSQEGVEDLPQAAAKDLQDIQLSAQDTLVAITASRRTPYPIGGIHHAHSVGAATVFITCNQPPEDLQVDVMIPLITGPEVVTGSTRMKAGTAQKLVLNMISTATMIQLGKTYGNLMVDMRPMSLKLSARSISILVKVLDVDAAEANRLLEAAAGSVKLALCMSLAQCDAATATQRLQEAGGVLRRALGEASA